MLAAIARVVLALALAPPGGVSEGPSVNDEVGAEPSPEASPSPEPGAEAEASAEPQTSAEPIPEPGAAPELEPPPPSVPAPGQGTGGFGQVGEVSVESNTVAPAPTKPQPAQQEARPAYELSGRAEVGYAQTHVGNAEGLDHSGAFLRAHLVIFPWISRKRAIAAGLGGAYSYAGLSRHVDDELGFALERSRAQQQTISLSFDLLVRPQLDWFAIHFSPMIGLGWYANAALLVSDRPGEIAADDYGFAAGGSLALCTAWAIACVSGGSQIMLGIRSTALELELEDSRQVSPWGWHVALGVDVARIVMRANQRPR